MYIQPRFLTKTFVATGLGFRLTEPAPCDLAAPDVLRHENPYFVVAAVLEHAKRGNLHPIPTLLDCMQSDSSVVLWEYCTVLLGFTAPASLLKKLLIDFEDVLLQEKQLNKRIYIGSVLWRSMLAWTIPVMLDMYLRSEDRDAAWLIPLRFSDLMESYPGPIFDASLPDKEYRELVMRQYNGLCLAIGSSMVPVKFGKLFSVTAHAQKLLASLRAMDIDDDEIPGERLLFEAVTGVDCHTFFDEDGELQPLVAAAIVEDFLESGAADKFEPGVRYFFGHRIPD